MQIVLLIKLNDNAHFFNAVNKQSVIFQNGN
jgi:hypothetical protein